VWCWWCVEKNWKFEEWKWWKKSEKRREQKKKKRKKSVFYRFENF
jgi:hypothetical protein